MRADILNEATANGGRVLCHREQPHPQPAQPSSAMSNNSSSSSSLASITRGSRKSGRANGSSGAPLHGQRRSAQAPASPLGRAQALDELDPAVQFSTGASGSDADDEEGPQKPSPPMRQGSDVSEDITQKEDVQPDDRVTAFWETIGEHFWPSHSHLPRPCCMQGVTQMRVHVSLRVFSLPRESHSSTIF